MSASKNSDSNSPDDDSIVRRRPQAQAPFSGVVEPFSAAANRGSSTVRLSDFLANEKLVHYLLHTNTFFHGKIGFYKHLLTRIYQVTGIKSEQVNYLHREEDLTAISARDWEKTERIILLPIVESEDALNRLVALALRKVKPVWLIAPLFSVQKHLLIAFSNFFVTGTFDELSMLQDIFQLETHSLEGGIASNHSRELFISDFEGAGGTEGNNGVTILPLEFPELPLVRRVPRAGG